MDSKASYHCHCRKNFHFQAELRTHLKTCLIGQDFLQVNTLNHIIRRANQQKPAPAQKPSNINSTDLLGFQSSNEKQVLMVNESRHLNCFLNSVIQLMIRVEPIKQVQEEFRKSYKPDGDEVLDSLQKLLTKINDCSNKEVVDAKELRKAMFKETYAMQVNEPFELYCKGDSNEVLILLLSKIHKVLSPVPLKSIDDPCFDRKAGWSPENKGCSIHTNLFLNVIQKQRCQCQPDKSREDFHFFNLFMKLIDTSPILERKEPSLSFFKEKLIESNSSLFSSDVLPFCINDNPKCSFKKTESILSVDGPLPEVLNIQTNWIMGDPTVEELAKFYASVSTMIDIKELYMPTPRLLKNQPSTSYRIKAMIMFTGNHYFFTIREQVEGKLTWVEYNDQRNPRYLENLTDVFLSNLEINARPTLIIYEKMTESNYDEAHDLVIDFDLIQSKADSMVFPMNESFLKSQQEIAQSLKAASPTIMPKPQGAQATQVKPASSSQPNKTAAPKRVLISFNDLYKLKKKYRDQGLYLYSCMAEEDCGMLIHLGQKKCWQCDCVNEYYDDSIKVGQATLTELTKDIAHIFKAGVVQKGPYFKTWLWEHDCEGIPAPAQKGNNGVDLLEMNSQCETQETTTASPLPKLPSKPNPQASCAAHGPKVGDSKEADLLGFNEGTTEQIKKPDGPKPSTVNQDEEPGQKPPPVQPKLEETKAQQPPQASAPPRDDEQVMKWRCPQCYFNNICFTEDSKEKCANPLRRCEVNIGHLQSSYLEDGVGTKMVTRAELSKLNQEWQEKQWECQKCGVYNQMNYQDMGSARCKKCYTINGIVRQLLAEKGIQAVPIRSTGLVQPPKVENPTTICQTCLQVSLNVKTNVCDTGNCIKNPNYQGPKQTGQTIYIQNKIMSFDAFVKQQQHGWYQVWKCPQCNYPNLFDGEKNCGCINNMGCQFNLEQLRNDAETFKKCLFKMRTQDITEERQKYDRMVGDCQRLIRDECWKCQSCLNTNRLFDFNPERSRCSACRRVDEEIALRLQIIRVMEQNEQEKMEQKAQVQEILRQCPQCFQKSIHPSRPRECSNSSCPTNAISGQLCKLCKVEQTFEKGLCRTCYKNKYTYY